MMSQLHEAMFPRIATRDLWQEYIPTTVCVGQKELTNADVSDPPLPPLPCSEVEIERAKEVKSSLEKWVKTRGGPQVVLKTVKENQWADTATWEYEGNKFAVADVKFFAEIEENRAGTLDAPLPEPDSII